MAPIHFLGEQYATNLYLFGHIQQKNINQKKEIRFIQNLKVLLKIKYKNYKEVNKMDETEEYEHTGLDEDDEEPTDDESW